MAILIENGQFRTASHTAARGSERRIQRLHCAYTALHFHMCTFTRHCLVGEELADRRWLLELTAVSFIHDLAPNAPGGVRGLDASVVSPSLPALV